MVGCADCPKRFHLDCVGHFRTQNGQGCVERSALETKKWWCDACADPDENDEGSDQVAIAKKRLQSVEQAHRALKSRAKSWLSQHLGGVEPFLLSKVRKLLRSGSKNQKKKCKSLIDVPNIDGSEEYIHATLRDYQVTVRVYAKLKPKTYALRVVRLHMQRF